MDHFERSIGKRVTDLNIFGEGVGFEEVVGEDDAAEEVDRSVGLHGRVVAVHDERFHFELGGETEAVDEQVGAVGQTLHHVADRRVVGRPRHRPLASRKQSERIETHGRIER